jgi:hydroxymethylpyrimidine/phosphomethylpyrimidine kinase
MTATALTVAGSDPSGGAGVQADLKTFSALGAYGTAVLTALTAQNTRGVTGVHVVPAEFVGLQLRTLLDDVGVHAVKTGMLPTAAVVREVAAVLTERRPGPVVCDPVMVATSGDRLIDEDAVAAVRDVLLPRADLITPNVPEAAVLLGVAPAADLDGLAEQARALLELGPGAVLLKGGHLGGAESVDALTVAGDVVLTRRPRVETSATHGTGCTLSAAIAALVARQGGNLPEDWTSVVEGARDYLQTALLGGAELGIGSGHGPVHHFAAQWASTAPPP